MSIPIPKQPTPAALTVHSQSRVLEVVFSDGAVFKIPFELMRVYSPSAEVQGHGPGQEVLQIGKQDVLIVELTSVGNYAVKPVFSDGHDTGLFTWAYLYKLGAQQDKLWSDYLRRLDDSNLLSAAPTVKPLGKSCGNS